MAVWEAVAELVMVVGVVVDHDVLALILVRVPVGFLKVQFLGNSWNSTRKSAIYQDSTRTEPGILLEEK